MKLDFQDSHGCEGELETRGVAVAAVVVTVAAFVEIDCKYLLDSKARGAVFGAFPEPAVVQSYL